MSRGLQLSPWSRRVVTAGNLGAAYQLDARRASEVLLTGTLNANNALTFTNYPAGWAGTIVLTQDATGNRTLTVNGSAVAVNSTPASVTVLKVYSPDGATVYVDAPGVDPSIIGASVKRTTAQSVANGGTPQVQFDTELWDTHGFANLGTSNTRITIPAGLGGLYAVQGEWAWAPNNTNGRFGGFWKNGALPFITSDRRQARAESGAGFYHEEPLAAGDYIEMIVSQDSGGALNLIGTNFDPWPRFTVRRLGPTP